MTADFYHKNLSPEVKKYLSSRGFIKESVEQFKIGFANGKLHKYLLEEYKFSAELCVKAGVLIKTGTGEIRDYFYKRIIFPNLKQGKAVHLSGRSLDGSHPKYLHLPGNTRHLFNEDSRRNKVVFLSEGAPDCIIAEQNGYPSVGLLGVSNFNGKFASKFRHCEKVFVCLDGDDAGRNGALKAADFLGEKARIVLLPEGLDLNDFFSKHSKQEFDELLKLSVDAIQYRISQIPSDTKKADLPVLIDLVLRQLASVDEPRREAGLSLIKERFKQGGKGTLCGEDIKAYRNLIKAYRKEAVSERANSGDGGPGKVYTATFEGLIDVVEHQGQPAFLIQEDQKIVIRTEVEKEGVIFVPPPQESIPWLLPRGEEVLKLYEMESILPQKDCDAALYDDLFKYHKSISELPSEGFYHLITLWVFHTYLADRVRVRFSPMICLFAVPERGKSRTGKGMIYVAYRGLIVESLRDPYLIRVASDLNASLFLDVVDVWDKAEKNGTEDVLLHRYEKGAKVPRVLYPDRGPHQDIVYYDIFGPTIIGTNESLNQLLETRGVLLQMPDTNKKYDIAVTPQMALPLKERLLVFRARHLETVLPDIPKPASRRLGDILKPLHQIIRLVRPEKEGDFLSLVKEIEAKRLLDKADSLEAEIIRAISILKPEVRLGILPNKVITDSINVGRTDRFKFSYQKIGRRLAALGFDKGRTEDGAAAIIFNEKKLVSLAVAYGVSIPSGTSDTSGTSEAGITDDTDVSDLFQDPH